MYPIYFVIVVFILCVVLYSFIKMYYNMYLLYNKHCIKDALQYRISDDGVSRSSLHKKAPAVVTMVTGIVAAIFIYLFKSYLHVLKSTKRI